MQGAMDFMGGAGGFLGTAGQAIGTASSLYNLLGPQSPLRTGDISGLASDISGIGKGLTSMSKAGETAKAAGPQVDVGVMSRAQPSELAGLPTDIRHQILAAMLKDIK